MPLDDFLGGLMDVGGANKRWRSWWAILSALVGFAIGGYLGYEGGLWAAVTGAFTGALIGWVLA
ncbi:MAG: hypothetical protein HKN02_10140, partial [Rhodobacteraceae bacterium]|nr:hypothetical protein [Paracoccaceae bacterium]